MKLCSIRLFKQLNIRLSEHSFRISHCDDNCQHSPFTFFWLFCHRLCDSRYYCVNSTMWLQWIFNGFRQNLASSGDLVGKILNNESCSRMPEKQKASAILGRILSIKTSWVKLVSFLAWFPKQFSNLNSSKNHSQTASFRLLRSIVRSVLLNQKKFL